ncbi:MAG TPA: FkbM family methyltransferase [Opitutaceae bacterium]|nr:FkbM family methyltransferase [Opitutaceae bacterium]
MLQRLIHSIRFRARRRQLGLNDTAADTTKFAARIAGRRIELSFPAGEREVLIHEFGKIFLEDCYELAALPRRLATVLDIGANVGLFSLAARDRFRRATIHCYEPNPALAAALRANVAPFGIVPHLEAVGDRTGRISLQRQQNSLHTTAALDADGALPQVSLTEAVQRLGGRIDLLKLDCEGAEWAQLECREAWSAVRHLVMEYHLWARPGATLEKLLVVLRGLGFSILRVAPSADGSFGLLRAARTP